MSATTLRRLIVVTLIVLWEALPRTGAIPELFLPSLSSTLQAGWSEAGEYGQRYTVDFSMTSPVGSATVRSTWIVRKGEDCPRLTTCFIL